MSERLILQDAKIEAIEVQIKGLTSAEDFFGMESRLEEKLREMKLEMHKKEDKISEVSAQFTRVKEHVDKLKDLKTLVKRIENMLRNSMGVLSHDLANLKMAFELLRLTSAGSTSMANQSQRNCVQGERQGAPQGIQKGGRGAGNGAQGKL